MNIIPIKELKNTDKVEELCKTSKSPVFITKNGYGSLVVMDMDYYSNTMKKIEEAKIIFEGLEDVKNNNIYDGKEVIGELKEKYCTK